MLDYMEDEQNTMRSMGIRVRYLLFDGSLSSLPLPRYLEKRSYTYAIRFRHNSVTKGMNLKDGEDSHLLPMVAPSLGIIRLFFLLNPCS